MFDYHEQDLVKGMGNKSFMYIYLQNNLFNLIT